MTDSSFTMYLSRMSGLLPAILVLIHPCLGTVTGAHENRGVSSVETCKFLRQSYPDITHFGNEPEYKILNEDYFTAASWLGPACIFAPTSAELMSFAVKVLVETGVPFAVRGGGHMPIFDSNNINFMGILLSSSGLKQLRLSEDRATVTVGPANSWGDVYRYLDPAGLTAVGGRLGVVGVPGFLLGGGISFFSNEYGWASANVKSYEAILSDGEIVTATANNEYSDLFWALRGGGNSFAIVTSFDLKTVDAPVVTVGVAVYGIGQSENFLDSVYHYALDGSQDKKSAVIPNCQWSSASPTTPSYTSYLFYNGKNTRPEALSNFTTSAAMSADLTDVIPRTMGQWATASEIGWDQAHGLHFRFRVLAFRANREAMSIVHDTFMALANQHLAALPGMGFTITFMPISKSSITANRGHGRLGDPMGIDESQGPFIWVEASSMFPNGEHEEAVTYFYDIVNAEIESKLGPLNVLTSYLYLNDADKRQPVFEGYGRENLARLKKIRDKYDPDRVYTDQMPGGFKVAAAK